MKNLHGVFMAMLSLATVLGMTGCMDPNNNNNQSYYNDPYYYGYYPTTAPRYMLMRSGGQDGRVEYVSLNEPLNNQQDVARYHNANYKPMKNKEVIDHSRGYEKVDKDGEAMYFVEHQPNSYKNPHSGSAKPASYWWNTYRYSCNTQMGYFSYNYYCNYNWNHIYSPYNYSWYNNWAWRPTYYYNYNYWYFAPAWNNYYYYQGYYYYYFWIPGY